MISPLDSNYSWDKQQPSQSTIEIYFENNSLSIYCLITTEIWHHPDKCLTNFVGVGVSSRNLTSTVSTECLHMVLRGSKGSRGVQKGLEGYRGVSRGTEGYQGVPRGTEGHQRVLFGDFFLKKIAICKNYWHQCLEFAPKVILSYLEIHSDSLCFLSMLSMGRTFSITMACRSSML